MKEVLAVRDSTLLNAAQSINRAASPAEVGSLLFEESEAVILEAQHRIADGRKMSKAFLTATVSAAAGLLNENQKLREALAARGDLIGTMEEKRLRAMLAATNERADRAFALATTMSYLLSVAADEFEALAMERALSDGRDSPSVKEWTKCAEMCRKVNEAGLAKPVPAIEAVRDMLRAILEYKLSWTEPTDASNEGRMRELHLKLRLQVAEKINKVGDHLWPELMQRRHEFVPKEEVK